MSDLAANKGSFSLPDPLPEFDALVVAGDVGFDMEKSIRWAADMLGSACRGRPLIFVPGDGEFQGPLAMREALARGKALAREADITFLSDGIARVPDKGGSTVFVLGAVLWPDFAAGAPCTPAQARAFARQYWPCRELALDPGRPFAPHDASGLHARSRAFIEDALQSIVVQSSGLPVSASTLVPGVSPGDRAVVVTHFPPSRTSLPPEMRRRADPWKAAFHSSAVEPLMQRWGAPIAWVHGHVPEPVEYRVSDCRVLANPRAGGSFDPTLLLEV
jgi:hypothetical protein